MAVAGHALWDKDSWEQGLRQLGTSPAEFSVRSPARAVQSIQDTLLTWSIDPCSLPSEIISLAMASALWGSTPRSAANSSMEVLWYSLLALSRLCWLTALDSKQAAALLKECMWAEERTAWNLQACIWTEDRTGCGLVNKPEYYIVAKPTCGRMITQLWQSCIEWLHDHTSVTVMYRMVA
jgi:hypothetical protein